jgi:hypothetical protein
MALLSIVVIEVIIGTVVVVARTAVMRGIRES